MTRGELRRALREKKKALRQVIADQRRQSREALARNPAVQRARKRRRIRRSAGLAVLALLLLFVRCECEPPAPPALPQPPAEAPAKQPKPKPAAKAAPKPPRQGPLHGAISQQPRGKYAGADADAPSWLEEFRIQVAARSPRLSQCFTGSEKPGAIRWTSSVNAKSGTVSEPVLEPLGLDSNGWATMLSKKQRECVVRALSTPTYHLKSAESQALSSRISLVIEF